MTEHDQSRDRPGDEMVRFTVAEAAEALGISEAGVRKRVQRNQIPHERGNDGRLFVWVSPGETRHAESRDEPDVSRDSDRLSGEASLVPELRDRIRYLERQVEEEREARRRADTILAQLSQANAEQARTIRALEPLAPPETPGPREEPDTSPVHPERAEPAEPVDPQREEPERVEPERAHPRGSPVAAADEQQGRGPIPDAGGPQTAREQSFAEEEPERRSWWRRLIGG